VTVGTSILIFLSVFFGWPKELGHWLTGRSTVEAPITMQNSAALSQADTPLDNPAVPSVNISSITNSQGIVTFYQTGNNTINNGPPKPEMREVSRQDEVLPDGTHKHERKYQMNVAYGGLLNVR